MTNEMNCTVARDEMLGADLAELKGDAGSPLAAHIRTCAACAAYASALVQGHASLARGLDALAPAASVIPLRRNPLIRWLPLPLAAAAVIALVMVQARQDDALPNVDAVARLMFRETPVVAPPAGQQAMVIEKKDMTIVWLYNQESI